MDSDKKLNANAYQLFQQRVLHTKFDIYVLSYQSITLSTQPHMRYIVVTIFGCYTYPTSAVVTILGMDGKLMI
jgi:hypothetical protein